MVSRTIFHTNFVCHSISISILERVTFDIHYGYYVYTVPNRFLFRSWNVTSQSACSIFCPALLCLRRFLYICIFTKSKNVADIIWKSEHAIPVNIYGQNSKLLFARRHLESELDRKLLRLVFTLQWERCKNQFVTTRTTWKSGSPHRRFAGCRNWFYFIIS
jgi:hypothetical protein